MNVSVKDQLGLSVSVAVGSAIVSFSLYQASFKSDALADSFNPSKSPYLSFRESISV